jgi:DNA repair exonuclease SbcCD ATPase subunit
MTKTLTPSEYVARKSELQGHLAAAQDAYSHAAAKFEAGDIKEAELTKARETVATIRDRLDGLESAWGVAQEAAAANARAADHRARREALAAVEKALAAKAAAAKKMEEHDAGLKAAAADIAAANRTIRQVAVPYLKGERGDILGWAEHEAQLERAAANFSAFPGERGPVAWVEMTNGQTRAKTAAILPEAEDEREAA